MSAMLPKNKEEFARSILQRNRQISRAVVAQCERLEEELRKLGVDLGPHYSLSPPLGDTVRQIHNQSPRPPNT